MKAIALFAFARCLMPSAYATDPVAAGKVSSLSLRNNGGTAIYVTFQLTNGSTNSCSPCPGDPAGMASGGYCWISPSQTTQLAILLSAKMAGLTVSGRVNGITSDCTVYQLNTAQCPESQYPDAAPLHRASMI
jgi:hypothetical protein